MSSHAPSACRPPLSQVCRKTGSVVCTGNWGLNGIDVLDSRAIADELRRRFNMGAELNGLFGFTRSTMYRAIRRQASTPSQASRT